MQSPPQYQQPPLDPQFRILQEQAEQQNLDALGQTARIDTARLMAQYGTRLALGGAPMGGSPLTMPSLDVARGQMGARG